MAVLRHLIVVGTAVSAFAVAAPAQAQFYFKGPDVRGAPVTGAEPGIVGPALANATPKELRAALVWNMRAALNVAALQCQFAPTLLTLSNYNALLSDHSDELKASYDTLTNYFLRTAKTKKEGQSALDQYGTRIYSGFSVVAAQLTFCQTAGDIGHAALFVPRGSLGTLAEERMREMRNSLTVWGEQSFPRGIHPGAPRLPRLDDVCWKKGNWNAKKCGAQAFGGGV